MGIFLNKNKDGTYRRTWYATIFRNGKKTTQALRTPLRGRIPVDGNGRFSLAFKGDNAFESSKASAKTELQSILDTAKIMKAEERLSPGYAEREAYRKTVGKEFEILGIRDLPLRNAERPRYALTGNPQADKYNQSIKDLLTQFTSWCLSYKDSSGDTPKKLTDITIPLVSDYYRQIAGQYSWQTFRKYVFILASVFRYFMPRNAENPFERVYEDVYKGSKSRMDKTTVVHEAPSTELILKLWRITRNDEQRPFLHRLAVLAACTGMRIGDCCNLTWDKVDMLNFRITTKTAKTGKQIAVPIFDYDPDADDFHPVLGELRRELEAALTERKRGCTAVIPEAAAIYRDNPTRINKLGKALFAKALYDGAEPEEAVLADAPTPKRSPMENIRLIRAAKMKEAKRDRLIRTYELHLQGKTYSQIATVIGNNKGNVSEDLATLEDLTGEKLRAGNPYMGANARPGLRTLLKKTRRTREQGQRAACLYGWHSCRVFFVVTAIDAGIKPDDLRLIVGHSTVRMVLHYYNPEELVAAEKMRKQIRQKRLADTAPASVSAAPTALLASAIQSVLTNPDLTPEARNAAILALTRPGAPARIANNAPRQLV